MPMGEVQKKMPRSLKDYQGKDPPDAESKAEILEAVKQRSGRSESELFSELCEVTKHERAEGRMNNLYLEDIYEKLAPMLTQAQCEKMREVLRRLKE